MTGKRLLKRVILVTGLALGILVFAQMNASASPIRPALKKVLSEQQADPLPTVPARAGWKGPEVATARTAPNSTFEKLRPENSARLLWGTLAATVVPDWRIIALILLVILLLRRIRLHHRRLQIAAAPATGPAALEPVPEAIGPPPAAEHPPEDMRPAA